MSSSAVVWHQLECGSYREDLELWLALAERCASAAGAARVLDVGAGAGRVALELARAGHRVTALDLDGDLLDAVRGLADGVVIETVRADARSFELAEKDFDLCLLAMQTVQLLDAPGRSALLRRARAHLRSGGLVAMAIVTDFEPFDCDAGDPGPEVESARLNGVLYASRATRVRVLADRVLIERVRTTLPLGHGVSAATPAPPRFEHEVVELHRVEPAELETEARAAGLQPAFGIELAPTEEYVGSTVVVLRA